MEWKFLKTQKGCHSEVWEMVLISLALKAQIQIKQFKTAYAKISPDCQTSLKVNSADS